ncbi:MAG: signal peptidase I [Alphaproteobacteria bacterium]|nr:signal peptidase I [Alphaproteobacteria bacterium]
MSEAKKKRDAFATAVVVLALLAAPFVAPFGLGFRTFRAPSGSMQPAIYPGDYFVISKWTYGYGRYSFAPFPGFSERVMAHTPSRGDIAVFRPKPEPDRDFVKRVVGLPGDRVQMIDGALHLNGEAVPREDLGATSFRDEHGASIDVHAYRETLPGGASYVVIDRGETELDNTQEFVVPEGSLFVMGDDRDNSADSRIPSLMGYVPMDNLVGRVQRVLATSRAERLEAP